LKINTGCYDAAVDPVKIFEQVNAGGTMHLRKAECYIGLSFTGELGQLFNDGCIIQVCKAATGKFSFCFYAGCFIQVVITAQVIFI
jgi:hypothetical protein